MRTRIVLVFICILAVMNFVSAETYKDGGAIIKLDREGHKTIIDGGSRDIALSNDSKTLWAIKRLNNSKEYGIFIYNSETLNIIEHSDDSYSGELLKLAALDENDGIVAVKYTDDDYGRTKLQICSCKNCRPYSVIHEMDFKPVDFLIYTRLDGDKKQILAISGDKVLKILLDSSSNKVVEEFSLAYQVTSGNLPALVLGFAIHNIQEIYLFFNSKKNDVTFEGALLKKDLEKIVTPTISQLKVANDSPTLLEPGCINSDDDNKKFFYYVTKRNEIFRVSFFDAKDSSHLVSTPILTLQDPPCTIKSIVADPADVETVYIALESRSMSLDHTGCKNKSEEGLKDGKGYNEIAYPNVPLIKGYYRQLQRDHDKSGADEYKRAVTNACSSFPWEMVGGRRM